MSSLRELGVDGEAPRFAEMSDGAIAAWVNALPAFRGKGVGEKIRTAGYATALGLSTLDVEELEHMGVQRGLAKQLLKVIEIAFREARDAVDAEVIDGVDPGEDEDGADRGGGGMKMTAAPAVPPQQGRRKYGDWDTFVVYAKQVQAWAAENRLSALSAYVKDTIDTLGKPTKVLGHKDGVLLYGAVYTHGGLSHARLAKIPASCDTGPALWCHMVQHASGKQVMLDREMLFKPTPAANVAVKQASNSVVRSDPNRFRTESESRNRTPNRIRIPAAGTEPNPNPSGRNRTESGLATPPVPKKDKRITC